MDAWLVALLVIIALLVIGGVAYYVYYTNQKRSRELRDRFGPEYEHTVSTKGRREAERELSQRQERVERLHIRELEPDERRSFSEQWQRVQARFVDEPSNAIGDADALVQQVMERRGYPVGDFEERTADISVDHPNVVTHYREAHTIAIEHERDGVSTERLRQAMIHYRALFDELLGEVSARR